VKILLVEPIYHWEGHPRPYAERLATALRENGADVEITTFVGDLGEETRCEGRVRLWRAIPAWAQGPALVPWKGRGRSLRSALVARTWEGVCTVWDALRRTRAIPEVVLHVLDGPELPVMSVLATARRRAVAYNLNSPPHDPPDARTATARARTKLRRVALQRNAIAFICHSDEVAASYAARETHPLYTIPWGVDEGRIQDRVAARRDLGLPARHILLAFGVNHDRKNVEVIFEALARLPEDVMLLWVGRVVDRDPSRDPYQLAETWGVRNRTVVVDEFIPDEDLAGYFSAADAAILSYKKNFLGASGVLSQAARFQLPVVAADVGQLGQLVRRWGLGETFAAGDSEDLREKTVAVLTQGERSREQMCQRIRNYASQFSWDVVAKNHLAVYDALLERSRAMANEVRA